MYFSVQKAYNLHLNEEGIASKALIIKLAN